MLIKMCQDFTSPVFALNSVPVANMLSDSDLHEQQAPPGEASESSDVSRLMSWVQNLKAKWVLMKGAIMILEINVSLLFKVIENLR